MSVEFKTPVLVFPPGSFGRRTLFGNATFSGPVLDAGVGLNGFLLEYDNNVNNVNKFEIDTDRESIVGNTVNFKAEVNIADSSANDTYSGYVTMFVIAEV